MVCLRDHCVIVFLWSVSVAIVSLFSYGLSPWPLCHCFPMVCLRDHCVIVFLWSVSVAIVSLFPMVCLRGHCVIAFLWSVSVAIVSLLSYGLSPWPLCHCFLWSASVALATTTSASSSGTFFDLRGHSTSPVRPPRPCPSPSTVTAAAYVLPTSLWCLLQPFDLTSRTINESVIQFDNH